MKNILFAVGITMFTLPAFAQSPMPPAPVRTTTVTAKTQVKQTLESPEKRAVSYSKELQNKLGLNSSQYTQVLAVNTECIRKKDAAKAGNAAGNSSKDISTYRQQQFATILTPEQMNKLKALNAQGGKTQKVSDNGMVPASGKTIMK